VAGLRVLTYTLNDAVRAKALLAVGLDGVITDAVDSLGPASDKSENPVKSAK
jgi:glycerophosphoryl diester phosphodiesterase